MSGIAVTYRTCFYVVDGIEHRQEHAVDGVGSQQTVGLCHTLCGTAPLHALGADNRPANGHEQRSGDALAADVGYHQGDTVVINAEEVIEVAADVLGGLHRGIDVHLVAVLGEWREHARQNVLLDVAGRGQVVLQRLQLHMLLLRLVYVVYLCDGLLDGQAQVVHVDGLRGEVEGPVVHCLADVLHVTVGTHHDDAQRRVAHLVHLGQQRQTIHLRHVDVREDNLNVGIIIQDGECL